jgi:hypothetical protein
VPKLWSPLSKVWSLLVLSQGWYNLIWGLFMEEIVFKALKEKSHLNPEDIQSLLILCDRLFKRNEEISYNLKKALAKIDAMGNRLDFYRSMTIKEI